MTKLKQVIKDKRFTKESIIKATGISRTKFYLGLDAPNVFKSNELKEIAKYLGVSVKSITQ